MDNGVDDCLAKGDPVPEVAVYPFSRRYFGDGSISNAFKPVQYLLAGLDETAEAVILFGHSVLFEVIGLFRTTGHDNLDDVLTLVAFMDDIEQAKTRWLPLMLPFLERG